MFEIEVGIIFLCILLITIYNKNIIKRLERRQRKIEGSMLSLTLLDKRVNEMNLKIVSIKSNNVFLLKRIADLEEEISNLTKLNTRLDETNGRVEGLRVCMPKPLSKEEMTEEVETTKFHINIKNDEPKKLPLKKKKFK